MRRFFGLLLFSLIICTYSFTETATIFLKNGKELPNGTPIAIENGILMYQSEFGDLIIPMDSVDQIVYPNGNKDHEGIVLSTGDVFGGNLISFKEGIWSFRTSWGDIKIQKSNVVTSVNISKPMISSRQALAKKGITFKYVIDWLYEYKFKVGNSGEILFKIKKITISNNQIVIDAEVNSTDTPREFNIVDGQGGWARLRDEFGREYVPTANTFTQRTYGLIPFSGRITFPILAEGSKIFIFKAAFNGPYGNIETPKLEISDLLNYN